MILILLNVLSIIFQKFHFQINWLSLSFVLRGEFCAIRCCLYWYLPVTFKRIFLFWYSCCFWFYCYWFCCCCCCWCCSCCCLCCCCFWFYCYWCCCCWCCCFLCFVFWFYRFFQMLIPNYFVAMWIEVKIKKKIEYFGTWKFYHFRYSTNRNHIKLFNIGVLFLLDYRSYLDKEMACKIFYFIYLNKFTGSLLKNYIHIYKYT